MSESNVQCNKNYDHLMYGSGVMACDRWKEGLMDGWTDRQTEKVTYRCGCPT